MGEGRSKAPGWGELRRVRLTMALAVVTPTRRAAATSPLKGEVTLRHPQRSSFSATNRPVFQGTVCLNPPLEGEGRSEAPGWGDLRHMRLTMALAMVTPTRRAAATSPLKGEVDFPLLPRGRRCPEGGRGGGSAWSGRLFILVCFQIFHFQFPRVLDLEVASPPSSGPAGHLLPAGEKRELLAQRLIATPGKKSAVVILDSDLAGALESAAG